MMCKKQEITVDQHLPLIQQLVSAFLSAARRQYSQATMDAVLRAVGPEDLFQACVLAVLENAARYDPARGKATTFIGALCRRTLIQEFDRACSPLKVPRFRDVRAAPDSPCVAHYVRARNVGPFPPPGGGEEGEWHPAGADGKEMEAEVAEQEERERQMGLLRAELSVEELDIITGWNNGESFSAIARRIGRHRRTVTGKYARAMKKARKILGISSGDVESVVG